MPSHPYPNRAPLRLAGHASQTFATIAPMVCIVLMLLAPQPARALTANTVTCNIAFISIPAKGPRLMVKCDAPAPGASGAKVEYFAFHMGQDPERSRLILSMLMTAKTAGRQVRIRYYTDDTSTNAWDMGCNPTDCRPILSIDLP